MKHISIIRIGKDRRVTLPQEVCDELGLYPGIKVDVSADMNSIYISRHNEHCHSCGAEDVPLLGYLGNLYCHKCAADIGWRSRKIEI